jgi:predicted transcriptional regulator
MSRRPDKQCRRPACDSRVDRAGLCQKHYRASKDRGFIDSTAVRAHITALNETGMSFRAIAYEAAMTEYGVRLILENTRVQKNTAERIFAIPVGGGNGLVTALGTRRRVQALAAIGWPQQEIAARVGEKPRHLSQFLRRDQIRADKVRRIRAVFDELSTTPGPSEISRKRAQRAGWPPPLAWDDDTIDDPKAKPQHNIRRPLRFAEQYEELLELKRAKKADEVARELGMTAENAERQIQRYREAQRKAIAS